MKELSRKHSVPGFRRKSRSHSVPQTVPAGPLQHYDEIYDLAPISFLTLDRRGNIAGLNKQAAHLLGFPAEWLCRRPFLVFVAANDVEAFLGLLSRTRQSPEHTEIAQIDISISSRTVPLQVSIKSLVIDNQIVYRMALVDLTEIRGIETELRQTLTNWYSLVESAPDIIMTVDRGARINYVNRSVWGYPGSTLLGTLLTDYVRETDRATLQKCISSVFDSDSSSTCEISGVNGDKNRCYSFRFGPVRDILNLGDTTTTTSTTTTVTIRDITEDKRTDVSLRASREQLREFAGRLDQVREEERTRVAREIHDELGQALTILKMDLVWMHGRVGTEDAARKKLKSMIVGVDQTIEHVRKIVSELRPSILDEMGLSAALEWQLAQFQERTGIRTSFKCSTEDIDLNPDAAAALFRVVQEALTNIVRHAHAREVRVAIKLVRGILRIAIKDDGRGLAQSQIGNRKSFGIVGMRERVHRIGGEFNIFSAPGRGTRLEIAAPIK